MCVRAGVCVCDNYYVLLNSFCAHFVYAPLQQEQQ